MGIGGYDNNAQAPLLSSLPPQRWYHIHEPHTCLLTTLPLAFTKKVALASVTPRQSETTALIGIRET